jgi:hypothetical protein
MTILPTRCGAMEAMHIKPWLSWGPIHRAMIPLLHRGIFQLAGPNPAEQLTTLSLYSCIFFTLLPQPTSCVSISDKGTPNSESQCRRIIPYHSPPVPRQSSRHGLSQSLRNSSRWRLFHGFASQCQTLVQNPRAANSGWARGHVARTVKLVVYGGK